MSEEKITENTESLQETEQETEEVEKTPAEFSMEDTSSRIRREKDEIPEGWFRRIKEPRWYVVHTYSGHEAKVKTNIEKLVENRGMQDLVLQVIVPTEDRVEVGGGGQRSVKTRKIFPSYVLVKMIVTNESWYLVRNTQGVTGFVGQGSEPIPLSDEEIRRLGIEKTVIELDIKVGDLIKVITGPFKGFTGVVEEVNADKQTVRTKIDMFGRSTPVELEFDQVDKMQ